MKLQKSSEKKRLIEWDKRYIWHPFTQMSEWLASEPLIIEKAEGNYLIDIEGRRYLDGVSSLWVNRWGHNNREINSAIVKQIENVSHTTFLGLSSPAPIILAKMLTEFLPKSLSKVFFSDNGSTAVEVALKISFQYWQNKGGKATKKTKFVSLKYGYHGDTIGVVSIGGIDLFHKIYRPLLFESYKVESPYCYRCAYSLNPIDCDLRCANYVEEIFAERKSEIAALIMEPLVQAAGGIIVHPKGFLKRISEFCAEYGVLLILDEVATGFGITGSLFAFEQENVIPDILCIAKALSGGYLPIAATITSEKIFREFLGLYSEKTFFHGHTYTANPLAAAAGIANLKLFRNVTKIKKKILVFQQLLTRLKNFPFVGDIRQKGLIAGIELVANKETKEEFPIEERVGHKVCMKVREKGVILRPLGNVIVIIPPLSIKEVELKKIIDAIRWALEETFKGLKGK
ncbi:MAG: adenosylmethionine--8-amino-7-oxononanoate transaminase [Acidobacteriota bacterium]